MVCQKKYVPASFIMEEPTNLDSWFSIREEKNVKASLTYVLAYIAGH
jgi:hypothetical protein